MAVFGAHRMAGDRAGGWVLGPCPWSDSGQPATGGWLLPAGWAVVCGWLRGGVVGCGAAGGVVGVQSPA